MSRRARRPELSGPVKNLLLVATLSLFAVLVVLVGAHVRASMWWPPSVYSSSDVIDLTTTDHPWTVAVGSDVPCDERECRNLKLWIDAHRRFESPMPARFDADLIHSPFERVVIQTVLPTSMLRGLPNAPWDFQASFMWSRRVAVYVNDEFATMLVGPGYIDVPLTRGFGPESNQYTVTFVIEIEPSYVMPFDINAHLLVGTRATLAPVASTYADLLTATTGGSILSRFFMCVLFGILFLLRQQHREHFWFFFYGALGVIKLVLLQSHQMGIGADWAVSTYWMSTWVDMVAQVAFMGFLMRYFRRESYIMAWFLSLLGTAVIVWSVSNAFMPVDWIPELTRLNNAIARALRIIAASYGAILGAMVTVFLWRSGKNRVRLVFVALVTALLAVFIPFLTSSSTLPWITDASGMTKHLFEPALFFVIAAALAVEFGSTLRQRDVMRGALTRHLGRSVVDSVLNRAVSTARDADITAMFIDIEGFTPMTERHTTSEVFEALGDFYGVATACVEQHGGTVNKFVGDGIFAIWGAPDEMPDHAVAATRSALDLVRAFDELSRRRVENGGFPLRAGIGIHSGKAMVGEIGSDRRADFTAIGSTVNMAARIESKTRETGRAILVSEEVARRVGDRVAMVSAGTVSVKGFDAPVELFSPSDSRA